MDSQPLRRLIPELNPADTFFRGLGWFAENLDPSTTVLAPGSGAWIQLPPGISASVVLVGDVPQGVNPTPLTLNLVPGFQIVSQLTPQSISFEATGFPASDGDWLLFWHAFPQEYAMGFAYFGGLGWTDGDLWVVHPTASIGEAVFYQRSPGNGNATWTREFSVNAP